MDEDNEIVDIDWKFGVTAACSDENQEGRTFLQLKITYKFGEGTSNMHLEMGLNQFYTFLHELEKSKNIMEFEN